jgi:hypothetical protein
MAEPGITQTDILKLNKPDKGYFDWDVPLNENWDKLDFLGAGQLPLLYRLESERILEGADATGWALQGSVLDGDTYPTLWTLLKTAKDRAASKTLEIKEITYTVAQDEVTGMVFVDQANYDKGWANLKDSLGFIVSFVDEVKSITLPKRAVYDRVDVEGLNGFGAESLPNITGATFLIANLNDMFEYGAFYKDSVNKKAGVYGQSVGTDAVNAFDASRSSSTYQDGASVQPDHHVVYAYYKVGNTIVADESIDLGNVLTQLAAMQTQLAGKADKDLSNTEPSQEFLDSVASGASADISAAITINATSYTAPAPGIIVKNNTHADHANNWFKVNNVQIYDFSMTGSYANGTMTPFSFPVNKGDVCTSNTNFLNFYPFVGAM